MKSFRFRRRKPGGKRVYCDFELGGVTLPVPDHSTGSRRVQNLGKLPMMPRKSKGAIHLLVDSSGLKIHVRANWPPFLATAPTIRIQCTRPWKSRAPIAEPV